MAVAIQTLKCQKLSFSYKILTYLIFTIYQIIHTMDIQSKGFQVYVFSHPHWNTDEMKTKYIYWIASWPGIGSSCLLRVHKWAKITPYSRRACKQFQKMCGNLAFYKDNQHILQLEDKFQSKKTKGIEQATLK